MNIIIAGTGSCIPENTIKNEHFYTHQFYDTSGNKLPENGEQISIKLKNITGISERRYAEKHQNTSDLAFIAAAKAIQKAGANPEEIDVILLAHNFGDISRGNIRTDMLPAIAARVKHLLKIKNPNCIAFDIVFGCPGWIQALIIARQYIACGEANQVLVIGAETLSRILDPYDRDSMIYGDGAAAVILKNSPEEHETGILTTISQTFSSEEASYLHLGKSNNLQNKIEPEALYIKMKGKKIYEFCLNHVPNALKHCLDKAGVSVSKLSKIIIHQANEKMNEAILIAFYKLFDKKPPDNIMPMNIHLLGNTSVATVPTLLDMILNGLVPNHQLAKGDIVLMASVGAGMNINAVLYRM